MHCLNTRRLLFYQSSMFHLMNRITQNLYELERLTEEFTIEYTYNSNAIEGNTLTLRETDMVLRGLTIDRKPLKDHMEAVGHKEAFDLVRDLVKGQVPLSESIIKQIHYLVLADKREDRGVCSCEIKK